MKKIKLFIDLTRLNKPIGYMLLFWPCLWGLTIAYDFENNLDKYFFYLTLFFLGSLFMRSAGCIVNDIFDRNFDKKVERTKNRPLASGKVSIFTASFFALVLCILAFIVLINFNFLVIILAIASMPLAFSYPLMKRFTYWPQLFLGITFNYGLLLAWVSIHESISMPAILLYLGAIFWTLGYDTIYGYQDIKDDEIIGVKSTSIKFKKNLKYFISGAYIISILILFYTFYNSIGFNLFSLFLIFFTLILSNQILKFNKNNPNLCLTLFKNNNLAGAIMFFAFIFQSTNL